jgi:cell division protein FtsB
MIRKARFALLTSVVAAAVIVGVQFPLSELWHEHSAVAAASRELAGLERADSNLQRQVAALKNPSTIARLAHQDYGLVGPGETYEVVLPSANDARSGADPLADNRLPPSQLVPSDATIAAPDTGPPGSSGSGQSFFSRLVQRLEFWKAAP